MRSLKWITHFLLTTGPETAPLIRPYWLEVAQDKGPRTMLNMIAR